MQSQHDIKIEGRNVVAFFSNAKPPLHLLSNFAEMPVVLNGKEFPSSEHAFQASLSKGLENHFTTDSKIGTLTTEAFITAGFKHNKIQGKCAHWSKKKNIGILAKAYIKLLKKVGQKRDVSHQECESLFKTILLDKYRRNWYAKKVLLDTGDAYLLEFCRGAGREYKKNGFINRWGGMVVDGKVVGHNQMGSLLMWVRDELRG